MSVFSCDNILSSLGFLNWHN